MIIIAGAILGGSYGAWLAAKRKGNKYDIAQYAATFAMAFAVIGLFATIFINRMM
ncbi:hypothetical protein [Pseudoruegeria sp. SK021]|uniref:hypothetical protein n=1 Tax=Pseudoruegeria sp. SK021 TaxID=1933035 RepID=UPI000A3235B3|nr:hypothetical protein [Pseudoruegeria sp. SK021]